MAEKDYYLVLGIARSESPTGVRSAFRDLVRRHHPDRAGPGSAPRFREIVEAYRVLSDPDRRREYDMRSYVPEPVRMPPVGREAPHGAFHPIDVFETRDSIRSSADALFDRLLRNFAAAAAPKAERLEPLLCDVALTAAEATVGGVLPIQIPISAACRSCHGAGSVAGFSCRVCDAAGSIATQVVVPLRIPPRVQPGTIIEASLDRWGIRNLWLRARIGVVG
jgi:DnaJ-class molecular chaperone